MSFPLTHHHTTSHISTVPSTSESDLPRRRESLSKSLDTHNFVPPQVQVEAYPADLTESTRQVLEHSKKDGKEDDFYTVESNIDKAKLEEQAAQKGKSVTTQEKEAKKIGHQIFYQGIWNFRDVGVSISRGVKPGWFFRSGNPSAATEQDLEVLFGKYKVKTMCDLRSPEEINSKEASECLFRRWYQLVNEKKGWRQRRLERKTSTQSLRSSGENGSPSGSTSSGLSPAPHSNLPPIHTTKLQDHPLEGALTADPGHDGHENHTGSKAALEGNVKEHHHGHRLLQRVGTVISHRRGKSDELQRTTTAPHLSTGLNVAYRNNNTTEHSETLPDNFHKRTPDGIEVSKHTQIEETGAAGVDPRVVTTVVSMGDRTLFHLPLTGPYFKFRIVTGAGVTKVGSAIFKMAKGNKADGARQITGSLNERGLFGLNKMFIEHCKKQILEVLELFADAHRYPIHLFCNAGKDRTGFITMLVLTCVGISREEIIQDYMKTTEDNLSPTYKEVLSNTGLKHEFFLAPRELMEQVFRYLDEQYGSPQHYMTAIGFHPEKQALVKLNLSAKPL